MDLNRWKIFRGLDPSLVSKCKLAKFLIFPRVGFLVLQNDEVYVVTDINSDARLIVNEDHPEGAAAAAGSQVTKVESLCGKGIIDFYGHERGLEFLSQGGCVYSWNHQFDINPEIQGDIVPRLLLFPGGISVPRVRQVSSARFGHNLCLTSDGQVFSWGRNLEGQLGSGRLGLEYERDAIKVTGFGDNIVQVAAGGLASFTLDSDGMVRCGPGGQIHFPCWGHSRFYPSTWFPRRIENLNNIKKIAAGTFHVLALSESGELYFWGTLNRTTTPTRITIPSMEPVTEIGSTVEATYAVFQTKDTIYLWGMWCGSYNISEPKATQFASIDEAFASDESPMMLQPIAMNFQPHGVEAAWKRAFDDPSVSDIVFSVDNENVHANAGFLQLRSEYFRNMLNGDWKESRKSGRPIKIQGFSFRVFKAFLYFLYQESLMDSDTMTVEDLAELMRAADFYGNGDLRLICENGLKSLLTLENSCFVYTSAMKSNAQNLQHFVAEFMAPGLDGIVRSEEFAAMDNDGKRKLMIHLADLNVFQVPKRRRLE